MKRLISSKKKLLVTLSLTFFTLMILVAVYHEDGLISVYQFNQGLVALKEDNKRLEKQNRNLSKSITALKTDPAAIETIAREKLNLVKAGEIVYQFVRNPQLSQ